MSLVLPSQPYQRSSYHLRSEAKPVTYEVITSTARYQQRRYSEANPLPRSEAKPVTHEVVTSAARYLQAVTAQPT